MATQDYSSYGTGTVLTATQSSLFSGTSTWYDLCSLTLSPGLWAVVGNCSSARIWHSGAGYVAATFLASLRVSGTEYMRRVFSLNCQNEQRIEGGASVQYIFDLTSSVTVNLSGYWFWMNTGGGANFASGFRWDSGAAGTPAVIQAVKLR